MVKVSFWEPAVFLEPPTGKCPTHRRIFLASGTPSWPFCPHGTLRQSAGRPAPAKCHCLAFPLRAHTHLCFGGRTGGWGVLVWGTVGGKSFQEGRGRLIGSVTQGMLSTRPGHSQFPTTPNQQSPFWGHELQSSSENGGQGECNG